MKTKWVIYNVKRPRKGRRLYIKTILTSPVPESTTPSSPKEDRAGISVTRTGALLERCDSPSSRSTEASHAKVGAQEEPFLLPIPSRSDRVREYRDRVREHNTDQGNTLAAEPAFQPHISKRDIRSAISAEAGKSNWIPLGPSAVLNGAPPTRPSISGRVTGIAISANGQRVYVGSANGGVWRSDDAGRSWYPLMNGFDLHPMTNHSDSLSVGAIAIDPKYPDRIYVGSGEDHLGDAYLGVGPVMSDDGGVNWYREKWDGAANLGSSFFELAVDPVDPEQVVAATNQGLFRREPRNQGIATLPSPKPQSYVFRYNKVTHAASVNYWGRDGRTISIAWPGGGNWASDLVFMPFVLRGEPWILAYRTKGSWRPWEWGGGYWTYRVMPNGTLQQTPRPPGANQANGNLTTGWTTLMPFEMAGESYFLRYNKSSRQAVLTRWRKSVPGSFVNIWTKDKWPGPTNLVGDWGWETLMSFTLNGVPHFLAYKRLGGRLRPNDSKIMLYRWSATGEVSNVWNDLEDLRSKSLTLMPFELDGVSYFQAYDSDKGKAIVYRWNLDSTFTEINWYSYPKDVTLIPFLFKSDRHGEKRTESRFLAYRPSDGWTSLYIWNDNVEPVFLWTEIWDKNLTLLPFQMGYHWVSKNGNLPAPPPNGPGAGTPYASSVQVARSANTTAYYAAFWDDRVYTSIDGDAWIAIDQAHFPNNPGRISLAVQPTHPDVVYAQLENGHIWRFETGRQWMRINNEPANYVGGAAIPAGGNLPQRGMCHLSIAVAPDNINRIYIGGSASSQMVGGITDWSVALYRSEVNVAANNMANTYIGTSAHAGVEALVFTPGQANALWVGTDGGIFYSTEPVKVSIAPGDLDHLFKPLNTGLSTMNTNHIGQNPVEDAVILSSNQSNGLQRYAGGEAWDVKKTFDVDGDSCAVVVNPITADNGQKLLCTSTHNNIYHSADGGNTFVQVGGNTTGQVDFTGTADTANRCAPLIAATGAPNPRVAFGSQRPWYSDNNNFGTTSWHSIPNDAWPDDNLGAKITAMAFADNGRTLYAGLENGRVWKFTDNGNSGAADWAGGTQTRLDDGSASGFVDQVGWSLEPPFNGLPITAIAVDPNDENSIYVTFGGNLTTTAPHRAVGWQRVWFYDDSIGGYWEHRSGPEGGPRSKQLMNVQFNTILTAPNGDLYAGADIGIWHSDDKGKTWQPFAQGLPETSVSDLELFPSKAITLANGTLGNSPTLLRATTYGRGVYERILDDADRYKKKVQLYIRTTVLDRGLYDAQNNVNNPLNNGTHVYSREGIDIKISNPTTLGPPIQFHKPEDITFVEFADNTALPDDSSNMQHNQRVRLYVQAHNRGPFPADNVQIMIVLSRWLSPVPTPLPTPLLPALHDPPNLPDHFQEAVQAGIPLENDAPWKTLGILTRNDVRAGFPEVVSMDIQGGEVREAGIYCLLVVLHSAEDPFTSETMNVDTLTKEDSKAAMKYLIVH